MSVEWLKRVFLSALVRRIAYVFVAALLMTFCHRAHAQDVAIPSGCTQSESYSVHCPTQSLADQYLDNAISSGYTACGARSTVSPSGASEFYRVQQLAYAGYCPGYQNFTGYFPANSAPQNCASQPNLGARWLMTPSDGHACVSGCSYSQAVGGSTVGLEQTPGKYQSFAPAWLPNGQTCTDTNNSTVSPTSTPKPTESYDSTKPVCQQIGTSASSFCVQPGKECVAFADGTSQCWTPWALNPDSLPKTNKDGTQGASLSTVQGTSADPPANMTNPQKVADQNFIDGPNKGTMTLYSGTGFNNTPTQSSPLSGGTANGTSPSVDGSKDGTQNGSKCDGTGDCTNSGSAGAGSGKVYTKSGKTMASVWSDFRSAMSNTPIIASSRNFFTVTSSSSCQAFTVPATKFWNALTFDAHCRDPLASALIAGGYLLLAGFAYVAWKVAVG